MGTFYSSPIIIKLFMINVLRVFWSLQYAVFYISTYGKWLWYEYEAE